MTPTDAIQFFAVKGISMKQQWQCPHCGVKITTYVTLTEPPSHRCVKKAQRPITLQPKEPIK